METVDSKQQQLELHEVLLRYVSQDPYLGELSPQVAIAAVLEEFSLPQVTYTQVGNSVAVIHKKKATPEKVYMRVISVDIPRNIMLSMAEVVEGLFQEGVRIIYTILKDETYLKMLQFAFKKAPLFNVGTPTSYRPTLRASKTTTGDIIAQITLDEL